MNSYAFITGGLGFIGSAIARKLIEDGLVEKAICLDHFGRYVSSTNTDFVDYRKHRLDGIQDKVIIERGEPKYMSVITRLLSQYQPRWIFHLAALPLAKIDNSNAEEAMEGGVTSTTNILEICGMLKQSIGYEPDRFVYVSSSMVYGDFKQEAADETHTTEPKEIYGTMKLAGEIITRGLSRFYGLKHTIIRPSAVYGPTDMNRRVTQIFLEKAFTGSAIRIHGENEALDFTYVKDVAKGFVLSVQSQEAIGETFNITYGKAHTLLEYVLEIKKFFPDLKYEIVERDAYRPKRGTLSVAKAQRLLKYKPDYSLADGVKEYVKFVKKYHPYFKIK